MLLAIIRNALSSEYHQRKKKNSTLLTDEIQSGTIKTANKNIAIFIIGPRLGKRRLSEMRTAKALIRLRIRTYSESSLSAYKII